MAIIRVFGMAHADCDGSFHIKGQGSYLQAINLKFWAWSGLLLDYFYGICFGAIKCSRILMTERRTSDEAIADRLQVSIIVRIRLLGAKGMKGLNLKSACHLQGRNAILLLICSLSFLISGAHAELQSNEADSTSCVRWAPPNVWEIRHYPLKAVAVTILAAMTTIGVAVAGRKFSLWSLVPTIPDAVPEIQAIPVAVQALPTIPR